MSISTFRGRYKSYTTAEKQSILEETKISTTAAVSAKYNIAESTIREWRKRDIGTPRHKPSGRQIGSGQRLTYPSHLDMQIFTWVLRNRERNLAISTTAIRVYAKKLILPLNSEFKASRGWCTKFLQRHNLTIRTKTSVSQRLPASLHNDVAMFRDFTRRNRIRQDPEFILNMDETPLFFDCIPNRTVAQVGSRSVIIRGTGSEKKRCTVVLGMTF